MVTLRDTDDEASVRQVFRRFFASGSRGAVRQAEALGHDDALWRQLLELDAPAMGVVAAAGGSGADLAILAVVAEELGRALAPVALIEHQITAAALARIDPDAFADVIAGRTIATLALRPAVNGWWRTVAGAAVAGLVVGIDGDRFLAVRQEPARVAPPNLGSQAIADVQLVEERAVHLGGPTAHAELVDRWRALTASALVGMADAVLASAIEYVLSRKQFGVPIGTFQSVQHGLADLPGLIEGARLLAGKAVWALEHPGDSAIDVEMNDVTAPSALASMSILFAAEVAEQVTDRALHYHGGNGCALEYDVQLYYRRARAWPLVLGPPRDERRRLAALLLGETVRPGQPATT